MNLPSLPFELSEDATTSWLHSLTETGDVKSANQFYKVICQLRRTRKDMGKVYQTVVQLTPSVLEIVANIETSLLNDRTDKKHYKVEKLCIQLLRNLSLCYARLAISHDLSLDKQNQALYLAIQLIGLTQRITVLFHQFPSSTLWEKMGALYMKARSRNILSTLTKYAVRHINTDQTVEYIVKRNLLFAIFSTYRYSITEVNSLFLIAEKKAYLLNFETKVSDQCAFFWPLNSRRAPSMGYQFQFSSDLVLAIDCREVAAFLKTKELTSDLSEAVINQLVYRLDGYKSLLNNPIPGRLIVSNLIVGMADILEYLEKKDQLNKIQKLGSQISNKNFLQQQSIELVEYETSHLTAMPALNQGRSFETLLDKTTTAKIIETCESQFMIAESYTVECTIDNLVLLHYSDYPPTLGIIRQVKRVNSTGTQHTLIEKITGIPTLYQIQCPDMDEKRCIVMKSQAQTEVVLLPGKYSNGTQFELSSQDTLVLNQLVDHSYFFMRYAISFQ